MVLDPIPQSLPVHFFGSRPQPPTSPPFTTWGIHTNRHTCVCMHWYTRVWIHMYSYMYSYALHSPHEECSWFFSRKLLIFLVYVKNAQECSWFFSYMYSYALHALHSRHEECSWFFFSWASSADGKSDAELWQANGLARRRSSRLMTICFGSRLPRCNTLQHTATHRRQLAMTVGCLTATLCSKLQHTLAHRSTLQRTAAHCNSLQHTASHCNTSKTTCFDCGLPYCNTIYILDI